MTPTKSETVYVRQLALWPMKNFVYLVGAPAGDEAFVVDPAWDVPAILSALEEDGRRLAAIVLTHHHHDHVNGVPALLQARDVPVHVQRAELDFAASVFEGWRGAVRACDPGQRVQLAGLEVSCLHTPGHTPGAQCLHCGGAVFTGDTLFVNACGRCDFAGSDPRAMHRSLFEVLGALDDATTVFAGHDYGDVKVSSLAREKANNPYYQLRAVDDFVRWRMR
jgi:glyoxylase-like metal-dependent hydrolase (beta-lactamase superfamily II)